MADTTDGAGHVLVRLTTYVPVEVRDQVDAWAVREKRTRANLTRRLLENWLSAHPAPRCVFNRAAAVCPTGFDAVNTVEKGTP